MAISLLDQKRGKCNIFYIRGKMSVYFNTREDGSEILEEGEREINIFQKGKFTR